MARDFGVVAEDSTLNVIFPTQVATGARTSFANVLEDADIVLVKDGTVATITGALTHTLTFNADAGIYKLAIDLSADADFTLGSDWTVYGHPDTEQLDSVDVAFIICTFTIETAAQKAAREHAEKFFPGHVVATTTGNTPSAINLTEIVDADTVADALNGEILTVWGATDGTIILVRVTDFAVTNLLATVTQLDGTAMPFTVAANDMVWRTGQYTADTVMISGDATAADNLELFTEGTALGTLPKVDTQEINATPVVGVGTSGNKWRA